MEEHEHEHEHEHHHDHHHEHEHEHHHEHDHNHDHHHDHGHDHGEEQELSVKAIIISAVFFVIAELMEHLPLADWLPGLTGLHIPGVRVDIFELVMMVCCFVAYIICGKGVLVNAVRGLFHGELMDENFLMGISSIGAMCLGEFPEAAAIMVLYQIGEKFEDYALEKSHDSIEEIAKLRPDHATLKVGTETREVAPDDVETDSVIIVKPGDRIPIDGVVVDGDSFVDTSALTGESIPRHVGIGSEVLSGSINMQGVLEIRTTRHAGDSALSRILDLVENATENKTKSEQFVP